MSAKQPFEAVVTEHGGVVLRVCRAVAGYAEADDAWQETFLAALAAYPALPPDADVRAWLVTIAHRKGIDAIRARQRRAIPTDEVPERESALGVPGGADPDLWAAVAALPDKQRRALAYHHVAGLPFAEVAAILGGTAAAARRASADGMAALRTLLTAEHTEGGPR